VLDPRDLATIAEDLAVLAADAEVPITYRRYIGTTPGDPSLGLPPQDQYEDEATTATVRELTVEEVQAAGGTYSLGDVEIGARRPVVDARDRIVYNGLTWRPVEIRPVRLGGQVLRWLLRCRRAQE